MHSKSQILDDLIEKNNGYLITADAVKLNISKTYISSFIKTKQMEKVAPGIYILDSVWPDELYVLQKRNEKIIYSGETALYLHKLIDREYKKICFTVPIGYHASHIQVDKEVHYVEKDIWQMGVCNVLSISGNIVRAYNKEKCICELIKNRKKYEVQLFQTAVKEYMSSKEKNLSILVEYADVLNIRDEVMKYVEVLV